MSQEKKPLNSALAAACLTAQRNQPAGAGSGFDGPRAFRLSEARARLNVGPTKMAELVASGEMQSFMIGRFRYITAQALQGYIDRQIERSRTESAVERAKKVERATTASLQNRAERALTRTRPPKERVSRDKHGRTGEDAA